MREALCVVYVIGFKLLKMLKWKKRSSSKHRKTEVNERILKCILCEEDSLKEG